MTRPQPLAANPAAPGGAPPPLLRTLHGRLAVLLLALLCCAALVTAPLWLSGAQRYRQEVDQSVNRPLASTLAAHLSALGLLRSRDPAALGNARLEIKRLMVINPEIDVYLLDARGDVLVYSGDAAQALRRRVDAAPLRAFLAGRRRLPILGDDPRSAGARKVFSVAPYANSPGQPIAGYVYVILGGEHYESVAGLLGRSYILRSSLLGLAAAFAVIAAAGLLLFRSLTVRLRRLSGTMDDFQAAHLQNASALAGAPAPPGNAERDADEIDRLGAVFGEMAGRIESQMERIAQADRHRREMVGNVSHDLRTPLAALQGYLETLLMKEGAMTPPEQRGYLEVALRQCRRLTALVDELFELARLDASGAQIRPEPFSLGELAQDTLQQHRLAAERKGVRLEAALPEDLPYVRGDIGLIERVLHNLLENALRYTPRGGSVTVSLARRLGAPEVEATVADTGSGIAPADLPHVFERFYRSADQSGSGAPQAGAAGLGLAIAKRILELHGGEIEVASMPGEATRFMFRLPIDQSAAGG